MAGYVVVGDYSQSAIGNYKTPMRRGGCKWEFEFVLIKYVTMERKKLFLSIAFPD